MLHPRHLLRKPENGQETLSFRPRWLSNFTVSCSSHRESSERRNLQILGGPSPTGCPGKRPLRDFASSVFRDIARKFAARSASLRDRKYQGVHRHTSRTPL